MKKNLTKIALIAMSVVILSLAVAVGTLAYLNAKTPSIRNVFVVGQNISITLTEDAGVDKTTHREFKALPGTVITKDPTVTVNAGSEACYLFVKVETNLVQTTDATWSIDSAWTAVPGVDGVYYINQAAIADNAEDVDYAVLTGNTVTISTSGIADKGKDGEGQKIDAYMNFTAYAIQSEALTGLAPVPEVGGDVTEENVAEIKNANAKKAWDLLMLEPGINP